MSEQTNETVKAREWWVVVSDVTGRFCQDGVYDGEPLYQGMILVREVLPGQDDEVKRLRAEVADLKRQTDLEIARLKQELRKEFAARQRIEASVSHWLRSRDELKSAFSELRDALSSAPAPSSDCFEQKEPLTDALVKTIRNMSENALEALQQPSAFHGFLAGRGDA